MDSPITDQPIIARDYGIFARWPKDGTDWIHPEDVTTMTGMIPSERIFFREWHGDEYATLSYGKARIRIRPAMWETVAAPEYHVGDEVEICSAMMQNEPGLAVVLEVEWDRYLKCARYTLQQHGLRLTKSFTAADLRPLGPSGMSLARCPPASGLKTNTAAAGG
jgi:hypothetical protein